MVTPWFQHGQDNTFNVTGRAGDGSSIGHGSVRPYNRDAPDHHDLDTKERRFNGTAYGFDDKSPREDGEDLRSFTPLASPKRARFLAPASPRLPAFNRIVAELNGEKGQGSDDSHYSQPAPQTNLGFQKGWGDNADIEKRGAEQDPYHYDGTSIGLFFVSYRSKLTDFPFSHRFFPLACSWSRELVE